MLKFILALRFGTINFIILCWLVTDSNGVLPCQNGATFDPVYRDCICTPYYHGRLCELAFITSDPCANVKSVKELNDSGAVHRLENTKICDDSANQTCIDFSVIETDWYRLISPAGDKLISQCPIRMSACGSESPYFLVDELPEDNPNLILSSARAFRYRPELNTSCYIPEDTSYPVRILRCSATVTLYYLHSLPSRRTHYCIGDKSRCDNGSVDRTRFEPCLGPQCLPQVMDNPVGPTLKLEYKQNQQNAKRSATFYCTVYAVFTANDSSADGVRYLIQYEWTYRKVVTLPRRCQWKDVNIDTGKNRTFECESDKVLTRGSKLYGGTLICRVQARCNTRGSLYNSITIASNSHEFILGNFSKTEALVQDICPANCSARGRCVSGECKCESGYWGASCEYETALRNQMPIEISLLQRNPFCSSDNCSAAFLLVKPFLKSTECNCTVMVNSSVNFTVQSERISGDIVKCELKRQHEWLVRDAKMFQALQYNCR